MKNIKLVKMKIFKYLKLLTIGLCLSATGCMTDGTRQEILSSNFKASQRISANYKYLAPCWETHRTNTDAVGTDVPSLGGVMFQFESGVFTPKAIVNELTQTAELRIGDPNYHVLMILSGIGPDETLVKSYSMTKLNFTAVIPRWLNVLRFCEGKYKSLIKDQLAGVSGRNADTDLALEMAALRAENAALKARQADPIGDHDKGSAPSSVCFKALGTQKWFGSNEQLAALNKLATTNCVVAGVTANVARPAKRTTLIIVDFEAAQLFRLRLERIWPEWDSWSGFTRDQIFADDPSNGFDLPEFYQSNGSPRPYPSKKILAFMKLNGLDGFIK